jgi:hypothetical protein
MNHRKKNYYITSLGVAITYRNKHTLFYIIPFLFVMTTTCIFSCRVRLLLIKNCKCVDALGSFNNYVTHYKILLNKMVSNMTFLSIQLHIAHFHILFNLNVCEKKYFSCSRLVIIIKSLRVVMYDNAR